MKNKMMTLGLALLVLASPMMAQDAAGSNASATAMRLAAGYIAMGIAAGLCGLGQGRAVASAVEGMARNPGAIAAIRISMLLGLAFMESLALFTLVASQIVK